MTRRKTDSLRMYQDTNIRWEESDTAPGKLSYKLSHETTTIEFFNINKLPNGLFSCYVSTWDSSISYEILEKYLAQGGLSRDIISYGVLHTARTFDKRSEHEIGLILLVLDSYHPFDKNLKTKLLDFIGLSDFPQSNTTSNNYTCALM